MTSARATAAKIVHSVCYDHQSLTDAMADLQSNPDAAIIKEMCFGTIRFWISLIALLNDLLETPIKKEDKDIECLLCIGLYQLIHMRIPDHAVVNETVSATRDLKKPWASGLLNKLLRLAIEKKQNDNLLTRGITAQYAHPNWIIEKIKLAYPENWESILESNNQKPPLFLRVNTTKISTSDFLKLISSHDLPHKKIEGLSDGVELTAPTPVEKIPGFFEGFFSVQDASGQKVVEYMDLQSDHFVLDACAAPGSKTTHLLEKHPDLKKLVCVDLHADRLKKIENNIKRLQLPIKNVSLFASDITNLSAWWDNTLFDRILVDAPCSASGVIRRHPDIKLLRKKTDIPVLAEMQYHILNTLWETLKPHGKLIYTSCSIFPDENDAVIQLFLSAHPNAIHQPIKNDWGTPTPFGQQILTGDRNRDGFYYAILEKTK